jgi:glutamate/tyrosine decarboxylase-like PLP-dependent enzyme
VKKKISHLEKLSRQLEPSSNKRKRVRARAISYSEHFLRDIKTSKAHQKSDDNAAALLKSPIREAPTSLDKVIELLSENVDFPGLNPASPGHLGYIPGGGLYYSALGDYLAAVFDRYAGMFDVAPGAVRMENMLIRWLAKIVGFPRTAVGNLTTGGSLAHLMAIVTARDTMGLSSSNINRAVIYYSEQTHHSVRKQFALPD